MTPARLQTRGARAPWLSVLVFSGLLLVSCTAGSGPDQGSDPGVNVLWILLDTARTNLSAYGYDRETSPNIDNIAARGVLFENNFSQATLTPLSVPSYMSGRYFGEQCIGVPGQFLDYREVRLPARDEMLIPDIFRENGYETAMVTKKNIWFAPYNRLPKAFDRFIGVEANVLPSATFEELNSVLIPYLSEPRDKPFFLYVHAWDAHFPHKPQPPYDRWIDKTFDADHIPNVPTLGAVDPGIFFDERDQEHLRGLYDSSILYADTQIGRLLAALDDLGLTENTVVVVSSDHGEALAEDGRTIGHASLKTFDEVTHVPLIMAGPGLPQGVRVGELTENVDILPTLVELLQLKTGARTDGVSLLKLVHQDTDADDRDFVFTRAVAGSKEIFSLRSRSFRYELDINSQEEHLYPVPDRVANRLDVLAENRGVAREMKHVLQSDYISLWQARLAKPMMAIFLNVGELLPWTVRSELGVITDDSQPSAWHSLDDGLWLLRYNQLFAASFSEDTPPLAFEAPVPSGRYRLLIETLCADSHGNHPASSVEIRVGSDGVLRTITCDEETKSTGRFTFLELGTIHIDDGIFRATIDNGEQSHWTAINALVLLAPTPEANAEFSRLFLWQSSSQEEVDETMKDLKALGYL